jgi:glucose/arabinose dehydrogenase
MKKTILVFLMVLFLTAAANAQIKIVKIAGNLVSPVDIVNAGDGSLRLFIALQGGKIVVYSGGKILGTPFLNISDLIFCCGERGLLSIAFHPSYKTNGLFFVYYTNTSGNLVLARFKVSATNRNVAIKSSKKILLTISHPTYANHNGGRIAFGKDGFLYLSVGDGGGGGDQSNNAQNLGKLLGKILRINVNAGSLYSIPPGNPFSNVTGAKKEIWAFGYRNPWRWSFDRANGNMYIGDVGQNLYEEIDFQPANSPGGENYGWRFMEGNHCYNPASNCNNGKLKAPIIEYGHGAGCSVVGGYVYRGTAISAIVGKYLYSDYCSGIIWGATNSSGKWISTQLLSTGFNVSTFGEGENGALYVAQHANPGGAIYRIDKQ